MSLVVFFNDIANAFVEGNLAIATVHALGSLLAALVRKRLILSTEGASLQASGLYLAGLLVLGLVYWLQPKQAA